jgi:TonB-linked SusC/RagA family outer membrane protein
MRKFALLLACILLCSMQVLFAQSRIITGTVTDADDGSTLPGVSVVVKGTSIGTVTGIDGNFTLNIPQDAQTLVFTFVGMEALEAAITSASYYSFKLQKATLSVDEVVVTALGVSRERKSLGYTVQEVGGDDLTKTSNPNLMTSLSGKVAGLEVRQSSGMPGAPSQIFIRGARSFSGNNAPLYVVDGMPVSSDNDYDSNVTGAAFSNRALDINPSDIESVSVLKGQAAAALYGLRASNGVILITTKRGKGTQVGKPEVSITSNVTIDQVVRLPEVQQTYAQGFYGSLALANSFSWGPKITDLPDHPVYGGNSQGQPGMFYDGYKGQWVKPQAYNNPENFYSQNGVAFNNNINISNSTSVGNFSVGFGSTNQTGIIPETGMDRYTAKFAGDFNLAPKWKTGVSANYSQSDISKLPSGNDSWLFTVYGAPPSFDLAGTPFHQEGQFGQYRQISYRRGAVGVNPYWALENNKYEEKTKRFFGNSYFEYTPASWVSFRYQVGMDTYTTNNHEYQEMGKGNLPAANQYPTPANPVYAYVAPTAGIIDNYGVTRSALNSLFTANFNYDITSDLKANLLVGNELDHNESEYYKSRGTGFTTPGWNNLSNTNTKVAEYDKYARRTVGFFGNLNLEYSSMLYLNITARQDVVSSMPRDNRSFFYPSASLAFVFTEIDALKNNDILSFGKFRASYAEVGQAASTYLASPPFVTGGADSGFLTYGIEYPWRNITGYKPSSTLYDSKLTPQNTQTVEFGVDLRFLNNRIGLDYTFYNQVASNQIFAVPMAGSTGYSQVVMNAGEMHGVGHEIMLSGKPVDLKNFKWDIGLNYSKLVNTVIELAEGVESISLGGYVTPNIRASAGDTYPAIYGDTFLRNDKGQILVDEDPNSPSYGMPLVGEFGKMGDVSPDFILTLTNNITLFNLVSVYAQVDWKQGGSISSGSNRLMALYGTAKFTENREAEFIYPGFKADGSANDIKRGGADDPDAFQELYVDYLDAIDEAYVYETSFIKVRELGFSVNVPNSIVAPIGIKQASVGFVARNLLLWSTLPNFDPEASQGQGNMQAGMDYMSLPQTSSYGFTLSLKF